MSEWRFRLAEPADAEAFSRWAVENPQIDRKDIEAGLKKNNPTSVMFAVEKDGVVVAFAPFYCQMTLAHLGFNPDAQVTEKLKALEVMLDGAIAWAVQYGVREITTLSREDYGVAKWAVAHGFEMDPRQQFKLDINKLLTPEAVKAT